MVQLLSPLPRFHDETPPTDLEMFWQILESWLVGLLVALILLAVLGMTGP